MSNVKKVSKRDVLNVISDYFATNEFEVTTEDGVTVTEQDVLDYVAATIEQLDKKAEGARKRAAEKRAEGDELRAKIAAVLTDEYMTTADIIAAVADPDLTPAMVGSRMGQLVRLNEAHKEKVKVDNRVVMGYAAGPAPETETDEVAE